MLRAMRFRFLLTAAGLCLLLVLAACAQEPETSVVKTEKGSAGERPAQQFFDYRLIESQAGVKQWILQSDEMQKFTGQRDVILGVVLMDFFQEGEHFSVLTADSGRANLQTKNIHTWGNVVVVTDDGRRLETEDLYFSNETELIHNDVFNRFTRDGDVMTGIGLEATPDLEYIELKREVKAEVDDTSDITNSAATAADSEGGQN